MSVSYAATLRSSAAIKRSMSGKPNQRTKTTPGFRTAICRVFQLVSSIPNRVMTKKEEARGALKLREARQYLGGLSVPTMHRLIKRGLLKPNRATRHLLFPMSELERFLRDGMPEK